MGTYRRFCIPAVGSCAGHRLRRIYDWQASIMFRSFKTGYRQPHQFSTRANSSYGTSGFRTIELSLFHLSISFGVISIILLSRVALPLASFITIQLILSNSLFKPVEKLRVISPFFESRYKLSAFGSSRVSSLFSS